MKICDRCKSENIVKILVDAMTDESVDLCKLCADEFEYWKKPKLKINCYDCKKAILETDSVDFPIDNEINMILCKECFLNRIKNIRKPGRPRKDGPD